MKQPPHIMWGLDTHRELLQCFERIGKQMSDKDCEKLTDLLLNGPPRTQYRSDLTQEHFENLSDRGIYLRLAKLLQGGAPLSERPRTLLDEILARHIDWSRTTSERDEFLAWSGEMEFVGERIEERRLDDFLNEKEWSDERIVSDLQSNPGDSLMVARWRGLLLGKPERAVRCLQLMAAKGFFEATIWAPALECLNKEAMRSDCLNLFASFGTDLGATFLSTHLRYLTDLIYFYCRESCQDRDPEMWQLWDLLLDPSVQVPVVESDDPVFRAINSSIGQLAEALLLKLQALKPANFTDIPLPIRSRLEGLLSGSTPAHRLARLIIASSLAWLYQIKQELAEAFLSRFDWTPSGEARYLWPGFLMTARISVELWPALRSRFLSVFSQSSQLGRAEEQFYSFYAFVLLHADLELDAGEARTALTAGSQKGRAAVAWYWWRQAESSTDHGAALYRERLRYLLTAVWPIEVALKDDDSSKALAQLAIACGAEFPDAVGTIAPLLKRVDDPRTLVWLLGKSDYAEKFPEETLALLDATVGDTLGVWNWPELRELLHRIAAAQAQLEQDPRFVRLDTLVKQFE